jgi:hypothetical protein
MRHYYVGLDVHKASLSIAVLDQGGKLVAESVVETSAATLLTFLGGLREQVEVTFEEGTHAARPRKSGREQTRLLINVSST